jgi:hypothetical protein
MGYYESQRAGANKLRDSANKQGQGVELASRGEFQRLLASYPGCLVWAGARVVAEFVNGAVLSVVWK